MDYIRTGSTTTTCPTSPITVGSELYEEALVIYASCVEHQEFRLAQICALHIIVNPDELEDSS